MLSPSPWRAWDHSPKKHKSINIVFILQFPQYEQINQVSFCHTMIFSLPSKTKSIRPTDKVSRETNVEKQLSGMSSHLTAVTSWWRYWIIWFWACKKLWRLGRFTAETRTSARRVDPRYVASYCFVHKRALQRSAVFILSGFNDSDRNRLGLLQLIPVLAIQKLKSLIDVNVFPALLYLEYQLMWQVARQTE